MVPARRPQTPTAARNEDSVFTVSCTTAVSIFLLLAPESIDMRFVQVAPAPREATALLRSPGQERAVVLIHGMLPHPINNAHVALPDITGWETTGSTLVTALAPIADIFAL